MESVLALKVRTGEIDEQSMLIARRRLEADLGSRRLLVATVSDDHHPRSPEITHRPWPDRGASRPDALQLSVALGLKRAGLVSVFVAADQKLCRVAIIEGFTTLNPEQPITL